MGGIDGTGQEHITSQLLSILFKLSGLYHTFCYLTAVEDFFFSGIFHVWFSGMNNLDQKFNQNIFAMGQIQKMKGKKVEQQV